MLNPFFETYVQVIPTGGSTVYWGMRREFRDPGPYSFSVFWAEAPTADYLPVNTTPVVDTYFLVDPVQRIFAKELELFYKVVCTTSKGIYESPPFQAYGDWDKRSWLLSRDIIRREYLMHKKFVGVEGKLFKIKIWGPSCPRCADVTTGEAAQSRCPICYGTGKTGGYWPPVDTVVTSVGGTTTGKVNTAEYGGVTNDSEWTVRAVAYPHWATYDFFVETATGVRYVVQSVESAAEIRGITLINNVKMAQAPFTDVVYQVPVTLPDPVVPPAPIESEDYEEIPEPGN